MAKAQRMNLDMRAAAMTIHLATLPTELLATAACSLSGTVIMARLLTLPPYTVPLLVPDTAWHTSVVHVPALGCRPPPKAYTDITSKISGLVVGATAGLEPAFAVLSKAAKRLTPPSTVTGDGSVPALDPFHPTLAWWDRLRYQWRGRAKLLLANAAIVVSASHAPAAAAHQQRLALTLRELEVGSEANGQLQLHFQELQADLFLPHHERRSRPGAPSLLVPLLAVPAVRLSVEVKAELPGGRHPGGHHVFPSVQAGEYVARDARQGPIDVASIIAAQALSVSISVHIRSVASPGQVLSRWLLVVAQRSGVESLADVVRWQCTTCMLLFLLRSRRCILLRVPLRIQTQTPRHCHRCLKSVSIATAACRLADMQLQSLRQE
jgi:hypothetical protein